MSDEVTIGRLKKKIAKLQRTRDYHKKRHEHYASVIALQPYLEDRYNKYEDRKAEAAKARANEVRIKEQEYLIRHLVGADPLQIYEIDALYKDIIKAEYRKLNEKKK
ncbi:hypothetical protein UFOVP242_209 [uncultured Caudovirales phage]|uniref:Uncharacterized protein n=1 Tax=uncultured Caudovirales phage TaxID=2100421 RepID=A0A6J7WYL7_9CAUD|nr:hypothetical protein UFOVP242_209 [uncultured Caudovirales phage]